MGQVVVCQSKDNDRAHLSLWSTPDNRYPGGLLRYLPTDGRAVHLPAEAVIVIESLVNTNAIIPHRKGLRLPPQEDHFMAVKRVFDLEELSVGQTIDLHITNFCPHGSRQRHSSNVLVGLCAIIESTDRVKFHLSYTNNKSLESLLSNLLLLSCLHITTVEIILLTQDVRYL
ncbi:MAG: hypothetical protein AB4038_03950 [Prochloraceae cyanobacterium]